MAAEMKMKKTKKERERKLEKKQLEKKLFKKTSSFLPTTIKNYSRGSSGPPAGSAA